MTRLSWNSLAREYQVGVDRGVLYSHTGEIVPWNGLVQVESSEKVLKNEERYFDGAKYRNRMVTDSFGGKISAFTYPDELYGGLFDLSYRTNAEPNGYFVHLVYNARVSPTNEEYGTIGFSTDISAFQWAFDTNPVAIPGSTASSHLVIDTRIAYSWALEALELLLYGDETHDPRMPGLTEVIQLFEENSIFRVFDNGDGTTTFTGPEDSIQMVETGLYQVSWPSVLQIDTITYQASSL